MTDKARELLERALLYVDVLCPIYEEIRAYLAEPEVPFVRLTEEEVNEFVGGVDCDRNYELICAVENRLVEKNK